MMRLLSVLLVLALGATATWLFLSWSDPAAPDVPQLTEPAADAGKGKGKGKGTGGTDRRKPRSDADRPLAGRAKTPREPVAPMPRFTPKADAVVEERGDAGTEVHGTVLTPAGNPLPDVTVRLYRQLTNGIPGGSGTLIREPVTSDAAGQFQFAALKGGKGYALVLEHPAYARRELLAVELAAGQATRLPDLMLAGGSTLHGFITSGGGDKGIGGALVTLRDLTHALGSPEEHPIIRQVETDADGSYRIDNLAAGAYDVTGCAPLFAIARSANIHLPATPQEKRVDLRLGPGYTMLGRVIESPDKPVAQARIEVRPMTGAGRILFHALSDAGGKFRIEGLAEGNYRVTATREGYHCLPLEDVTADRRDVRITMVLEAGITGYVVAAADDKPLKAFGLQPWAINKDNSPTEPMGEIVAYKSEDGSFTIESLKPGSYRIQAFHNDYAPAWSEPFDLRRTYVHGMVIRMEPGARLLGQVNDGQGRAMADARVTLLNNVWVESPLADLLYGKEARLGSARTDAEGKFMLDNLAAGVYQVKVEAPDHAPALQRDVQVVANTDNHCGPFQLHLGGSLTVAVFDSRGLAVRGASVMLQQEGGASYKKTVDGDGEISFSNLIPGTYLVSVMAAATADAGSVFAAAIASAKEQRKVEILDGRDEKLLFHVQ